MHIFSNPGWIIKYWCTKNSPSFNRRLKSGGFDHRKFYQNKKIFLILHIKIKINIIYLSIIFFDRITIFSWSQDFFYLLFTKFILIFSLSSVSYLKHSRNFWWIILKFFCNKISRAFLFFSINYLAKVFSKKNCIINTPIAIIKSMNRKNTENIIDYSIIRFYFSNMPLNWFISLPIILKNSPISIEIIFF